jgi:hypothetical protein
MGSIPSIVEERDRLAQIDGVAAARRGAPGMRIPSAMQTGDRALP